MDGELTDKQIIIASKKFPPPNWYEFGIMHLGLEKRQIDACQQGSANLSWFQVVLGALEKWSSKLGTACTVKALRDLLQNGIQEGVVDSKVLKALEGLPDEGEYCFYLKDDYLCTFFLSLPLKFPRILLILTQDMTTY